MILATDYKEGLNELTPSMLICILAVDFMWGNYLGNIFSWNLLHSEMYIYFQPLPITSKHNKFNIFLMYLTVTEKNV